MTHDDPRHATVAGYGAGCRRECCRAAVTRYEKERRLLIMSGRQPTVPAAPVVRMTRELMALGWTSAEIAKRSGWATAEAVTNLAKKQRVRRETAARIRRTYLELRGTEGPSEVTRRRAAAKGWQRPTFGVAYEGGWARRGGVLVPTKRGAA